MTNKKLLTRRALTCILTLLIVSFIFINSALPADTSSEGSSSVTELINTLLSSVNINLVLSENFVRKLAHFIEYFVLSVSMYFTARSFGLRRRVCAFSIPLAGLIVASVDETIQLFSYGRSGQITDVLLDFIGVIIAVFILSVVSHILTKR